MSGKTDNGPIRRIGSIPHLFGKLTVTWCILCSTAASAWALRILERTDIDPSATLGIILAFFGGELMVLCLKTILGEQKNKQTQHEL